MFTLFKLILHTIQEGSNSNKQQCIFFLMFFSQFSDPEGNSILFFSVTFLKHKTFCLWLIKNTVNKDTLNRILNTYK